MKKILCLLLALIMVLGLAACGAKDTAEDTKPTEDSKPAENNNGGDVAGDTQDPNREATVVFMTRGNQNSQYYDEIKAGIEKYVKDTYNLNFELKLYSDYFTDAATPLSTGEGWDIAFINGTQFLANVGRNLFLPLDDYLAAGKVPTAQEVLPEDIWKAGMYQGKTYGLFPTKDFGAVWNMIANVEKLAELEAEGIKFPEDWRNYNDVRDFLWDAGEKWLELHPGEETYAPFPGNFYCPAIATYDSLLLDDYVFGPIAAVNVSGLDGFNEIPADTVFTPILTEQYKEVLLDRIALYEAGITWEEEYPEGAGGSFGVFGQGEFVMFQGTQGFIAFPADSYEGFTCELKSASEGLIYTGYVHAGFWVLNAKCEDPERVLDFAEALYADEQLCTMMRFGLEGDDWTDTDNDGQVEFEGTRNEDPSDRSWYYWYGFEKACLMTGKVAPGNGTDFADNMWAANDAMTVSQCVGFVVDPTNITNEMTALTAVQQKYNRQLNYAAEIGGADAAVALLGNIKADLEAAGLEKVIAEVQAQYNAFMGK